MSNPFDAFDSPAPAPRAPRTRSRIDPDAIARGASELGIDPVDLATAISYETAGTFDPDQWGPTTKWGRHRGLIQFGEPQRAKYGVRPGMTVAEQMPAVVAYLRDTGVRPGMGLLDVYSAINAGGVGRYNASDAAAGGAPGTVADKVRNQMGDHRRKAMQIMGLGGEGGGGGGGGIPAPAANPFDQFDEAPGVAAALAGPNPFDQFDTPDFSDVQVGTTLSGGAAPNYAPVFDDGVEDPSSFGKIGLRALVGRVPDLVANLVELPGNVAGAIGDAAPGNSMTMTMLREAFGRGGEAIRDVGYERDMAASGYGAPSVTGGQVLDALNPTTDVPIADRASQIGRFIPETLLASSPDMAAAVGALPAYIASRTNEVAENRAANDQRANPSVSDLAIAAPSAAAESFLERLTTMRLLPGGGAVARPGVAGAAGRVAKETGIQGATGAVEEAIPYLAETLGTATPTTGRGLAEALATGLVAEGGLGGAVQGASEVASAATRPRIADLPADPVNIADIIQQAQTILPAVAAEGSASPRQGDAPAAPPTQPQTEQQATQEVQAQPELAGDAGAVRPDMAAATRSIDDRLAALDEAAAEQIGEAEVSALNAERQELDDLVREQDRARREGIVQPLEARLSPEERATADARRQEIAATLERHRAARTAADQAQRLRSRLEAADTDAALYDIAREINPTLGTPQAESFRAADVAESAPINTAPGAGSGRNPDIGREASVQRAAERAYSEVSPVAAGGPRVLGTDKNDNVPASREPADLARSSQGTAAEVTPRTATPEAPAAAPEVAPAVSEAPRAEAQRQPAAEPVPGQTSLKNAVTDAERIAEGRDPIIREARKGNRETVDEAVRAVRETPSIGRETAQRLAEGGPVELKDEAILLVHKVDLRKRRDAAAERAQDPNASEEARAIARREYDDAVQQIDEVDMAARRIGTESGRLLQLRKRMIAEDYSLPALERKLQMVVNRDLKPAERAELAEMAEKVATLQRKLDAVESQQASAQVAEMLARLMKQAPGRGATLAQRRTAAAESKAALSAMAQAGGRQQSIVPAAGQPGQARAALAERLGRGVVARLERAGVLEFDDRNGGTWDGVRIGIGNVAPENALGVLLHEVSHANMLDVLGEQGYERALRDLDALEATGDRLALRAKRRAEKSGETGQRLDDERIAYMVEEATNAQKQAGTLPARVTDFLRSIVSAFRRWAATSAVFRALERAGINRPTLRPDDFVAFARRGLDRMVDQARQPATSAATAQIRKLEGELRTDQLTGLRNKRAFDEDASLGWPSVVAIDMDGLKRLNDAIGHEAADDVMRALADELRGAEGDGARFYRRSGDEFAARFRDPADAESTMQALQQALEGIDVELDVADDAGNVRSYTYQGIGISYGTGATYEAADAAANRQKADRLAAGLREAPRADGPSRRLRESAPRPGGRRAGDPPAVGAQRSIPESGAVVDLSPGGGGKTIKIGDTTIDYGIARDGETGEVILVKTPPSKRGQGSARAAMQQFLAQTDAAGVTMFLTADPMGKGGASKSALVDFYKSLGFRENKGRKADFRSRQAMVRDPKIMRSIPEGEAGVPVPAGADPVAFFHLAQLGAFHYADGAQDIGEWTRRMEADLGAAAGKFRSMLPDAFKAAKAQASKPVRGQETVAEAVEAIGDQRRPRDVKRVVRAVVSEGMRGEDAIIAETARVLDMDDADVRTLFVQSESKARTLTEAQAELKSLREQLRAAQRPDPETRYQEQRARDFERRIAELEERIAAGDFAKRERTEHDLIERNKRLQFEMEKTKERFHRYALEAEFQSRTPVGKIFGETNAGINFARAIQTSLDLSMVLRQGGKIAFGHPLRALKAVPGSLKAFVSEDADFRIRQEIESRPNAPLYKKFGLELTSIGGDALSRTEEAYASRWVDKLPTVAGGGLIRGSGRSYTAFLNRLRADSFDAMLAALARDGSNPTKEEGKAIANYVNVATGRGKVGKNEKSGEVLNTVFFAPRLVASRFQLLAGQPLYGGSNRTRRMIAAEYARFLMGVSVAIGLAMLMRDEDDETKAIELDPRSANFGKVRFGDETFLDPLAGLAQVTVFLARVASGETRTTTTDTLRPLRDSYRLTDIAPGLGDGHELAKVGYGGRDIPDVIASFLRSKLAPVPGAIINVATGKNMIGKEVTPLSAAGELVTPMSVGNLVDVMEAQGMARGTAINLLGILGMSVQYRKSDEEKAAEDANGIPGALGFGTAED